MVALTDAELKSAQLIARHLSAVVMRRASVTGRGPAYAPDANTVGRSSPLSPLMDEEGEGGSGGIVDGGEADMGMASGPGGGGKGASVGKASMGVAGLGAGGSGDERREWVLLKLRALVDSIHQLEEAASRERETHSSAGGRALLQQVAGWAARAVSARVMAPAGTLPAGCIAHLPASFSHPTPPPQPACPPSCWWCTRAST